MPRPYLLRDINYLYLKNRDEGKPLSDDKGGDDKKPKITATHRGFDVVSRSRYGNQNQLAGTFSLMQKNLLVQNSA